jgi:hypothetical protein
VHLSQFLVSSKNEFIFYKELLDAIRFEYLSFKFENSANSKKKHNLVSLEMGK